MKSEYYRQRIEKVLNHIAKHYAEDQSMTRLAEIACLSPYHWHRIFMSCTGETIYQCIRRTRLSHGARFLKQGLGVLRCAKKIGYAHPDSFIRAFKTSYGVTPHQFQTNPSTQQPHIVASRTNDLLVPSHNIAPTLQTLPALHLASIEVEADYTKIPHELNRLMSHVFSQGPSNAIERFFCFYYHDPYIRYRKNLLWRPGIATKKPILPHNDIVPFTRNQGTYWTLIHQGPYETLDAAWQQLYNTLTSQDLRVKNAPYFEEYLNNPRNTEAKSLKTLLAIPLEPSTA